MPGSNKATFSIASIVSVVAAIASFQTGAILGLLLAVVAILAGIFGLVLALSPARRGGVASLMGVVFGAIGIIAAAIKAVMWIFS